MKMEKFERKLAKRRRADVSRWVNFWLSDPNVETVSLYRRDRPPNCADWDVVAEVTFNLRLLTYDEVYGKEARLAREGASK